jgi:hypothetical protein
VQASQRGDIGGDEAAHEPMLRGGSSGSCNTLRNGTSSLTLAPVSVHNVDKES